MAERASAPALSPVPKEAPTAAPLARAPAILALPDLAPRERPREENPVLSPTWPGSRRAPGVPCASLWRR